MEVAGQKAKKKMKSLIESFAWLALIDHKTNKRLLLDVLTQKNLNFIIFASIHEIIGASGAEKIIFLKLLLSKKRIADRTWI